MPLTQDEKEKLAAAKLERLTSDIYRAINQSDTTAFDAVASQLLDMSLDIEVPLELRYRAKAAHEDAGIGMAQAGLSRMAEIADTMASLGSGLRGAIRVAETGKEELFFPSLAAAASKALAIFETFKEAAENLEAELEAAGQGELQEKLESLVASAKIVRDALEEV